MLTAILFTIAGLALGQFVTITIDPKLVTLLDSTLTQARTTATPIVQTAAKQLKSTASKSIKRIAPTKEVG